MKKQLLCLFCLLVIFALCACNSDNAFVDENANIESETIENKMSENFSKVEVSDDIIGEDKGDSNNQQSSDNDSNFEKRVVTLYFSDENAIQLCPEERSIDAEDNVYEAVLRELRAGPVTDSLYPMLSGDYDILSVNVSEGVCTVDFSKEFVYGNTGGSTRESLAIGSITASLCNLEGVEGVKINIEGNAAAEFGHSILDTVFVPNDNIIRTE